MKACKRIRYMRVYHISFVSMSTHGSMRGLDIRVKYV